MLRLRSRITRWVGENVWRQKYLGNFKSGSRGEKNLRKTARIFSGRE
jgi:hypothetical protein